MEIAKALNDHPLLLTLHIRLAMLALDQELVDKASDDLDKAWDAQQSLPDHERITWRVSHLYNLMGWVWLKKGDHHQAIIHIQKAIELGEIAKVAQSVSEAQWWLAEAFISAGLLDNAQENLDKASRTFARLGKNIYAERHVQLQQRIRAAQGRTH